MLKVVEKFRSGNCKDGKSIEISKYSPFSVFFPLGFDFGIKSSLGRSV
jgi:hypothetical protein